MTRRDVPAVLARAQALVDPALRAAVDTLTPEMRTPARYHFGWTELDGSPTAGGGGKGIRPALAVLSAEAVGADATVAVPGAAAVQLIHNFSLLHDDVIDGDTTRRHREAVWSAWTVGDAIIVGDALHALAIEMLLDGLGTPGVEAGRRLARGTAAMIAGQSADMSFPDRDRVTFDECVAMEADKTGALLAFSSSVGAVLADGPPEVIDRLDAYGAALGIAFQAVDDVLGIWGDPAVTGKAAGNDLRERKMSMPVTAALESGHADVGRIAALYAAESLSENNIAELADRIAAAGGRDRAEAEAQRQLDRALGALDHPGIAPAAAAEFAELAEFTVTRTW